MSSTARLRDDDTEITCALCHRPIAARQDYVFRVDGLVEHVRCAAPTRKPTARVVPEAAADPICGACSKPIEPAHTIVKDGVELLHGDCFVQRSRPIAGGVALPAWLLVGEKHIGQRLGMTRAGHQAFMAVCLETRVASRYIAARAREVAAATRAVRRVSAVRGAA